MCAVLEVISGFARGLGSGGAGARGGAGSGLPAQEGGVRRSTAAAPRAWESRGEQQTRPPGGEPARCQPLCCRRGWGPQRSRCSVSDPALRA